MYIRQSDAIHPPVLSFYKILQVKRPVPTYLNSFNQYAVGLLRVEFPA